MYLGACLPLFFLLPTTSHVLHRRHETRLRKIVGDSFSTKASKRSSSSNNAHSPSSSATTTTTTRPPHRRHRPRRLAIIGSGPAGFYSARRLLQRLGEHDVAIDMYERLPVPFGLVRFGVAPDHPEVKKCVDTFAEVAASPAFRFLGNVDVGRDVSLQSLVDAYDAVLFAYGAAADRTLGVPGEKELEEGGVSGGGGGGLYSARAFVGWYNGLPEYRHLNPRLDAAGDTAVVVGQGNVALDVARVLLSDVDSLLRRTDMTGHALAALARSTIRRVHVVGRRGPMQAAFTIKELRELLQLDGLRFTPIDRSLLPQTPKSLPRAKRRIAELLIKHSDAAAAVAQQQEEERKEMMVEKSWSLDFLRSPSAFVTAKQRDGSSRLEAVEFTPTQYVDGLDAADDPDARVEAAAAAKKERLPAALAFRSIGYRGVALPGMDALGINFDSRRGVVPNISGRVVTSTGQQIPGLYCSGWVKNGPTGVIATTMEDAFAAAEAIVEDWSSSSSSGSSSSSSSSKMGLNNDDGDDRGGWDAVKSRLVGGSSGAGQIIVSWDDWLRIDAAERAAGKIKGKDREKLASVREMLQCLA